MIINREDLIGAAPITPLLHTKIKQHGVSWGMSEAGYDIRIKQDVVMHGFKRFVLASSIEKFRMPHHLVGIVHDKSSWARQGLSVFNTVIEPGWTGFLTLELVYHGWRPLRIRAGSGIAQVIFHQTSQMAAYEGKYQNQGNEPIRVILS